MLTGAEYRQVIRCRMALQGRIDSYGVESEDLENRKEAVDAARESLQGEMALYSNFLEGAIEEYEAAHPPEE